MRGVLLVMIGLAACGGTRYRTEVVGHGDGVVAPRAAEARVRDAPGVQLPQGTYELAMRFAIPRAQIVDWHLACPGVDLGGQVGETIDQYRARRSRELTRDRDDQRARAAASIVLGAVANANVEVAVAGGPPLLPAPDDIGRGTLVASARVITAGDGVCALAVTAGDPDVRASFTITRIRDLAAEDRMRTIATHEVAVEARGSLADQLVTAGANPAAAPAAGRAGAEAVASDARRRYLAYLAGRCSAAPGHRDQIAAEEGRRREARLVAYAALAERRDRLALAARDALRDQLLRWGAKARPPKPAPKPEDPGEPPFDGAAWTAGYWGWEAGVWVWEDGGWSDPDLFDDRGLVGVTPATPGVRDHRGTREHVRDHRDLAWKPENRDSRGSSSKTRDHRSENDPRSTWTPSSRDTGATVRDHRKDDDDKQDDEKPRVRDHR